MNSAENGHASPQRIGTLQILRRYPFKSMRGEDIREVFITFAGLVGDRAYAFVDRQKGGNFPWMTAREKHEMLLFHPRYLASPDPNNEHPPAASLALEITSPEGEKLSPADAHFTSYFEKRFAHKLELRFSERAMQDACPVSMLGLPTVKALSQEAGIPLEHSRFRANFYAEWENSEPYCEDKLVGKTLRFGDKFTFTVIKNNLRCAIITLDPKTAQPNPEVGKVVARNHGNCFGVYGSVLREGIVRAGDPIYLLDSSALKPTE